MEKPSRRTVVDIQLRDAGLPAEQQRAFMRQHGQGQNAEQLRTKLRPFLLRRLKRDVLPRAAREGRADDRGRAHARTAGRVQGVDAAAARPCAGAAGPERRRYVGVWPQPHRGALGDNRAQADLLPSEAVPGQLRGLLGQAGAAYGHTAGRAGGGTPGAAVQSVPIRISI